MKNCDKCNINSKRTKIKNYRNGQYCDRCASQLGEVRQKKSKVNVSDNTLNNSFINFKW